MTRQSSSLTNMGLRCSTLLCGALLLCLSSAQAATVTWNLTSGGTNSGSGFGNVRTFTQSGTTLTASAWGLTGGGSTLQTAQLGQFSTGLGSCNQQEGTGCDSPSHQFDNVGANDFVLFQFSQAVSNISVVIDPAGLYDRDASWQLRGSTGAFSIGGLTLGQLSSLGFSSPSSSTSSVSVNPRTVNIGGSGATALFFAPQYAGTLDIFDDRFKITSITGTVQDVPPSTVPEPGTFGLLGAALIAGAYAARRRRAV